MRRVIIPKTGPGTPGPLLLTRSPRGRMLLMARQPDGTIGCWDVASGEELWRVTDDSISFSLTVVRLPQGRTLLASGGEDGVCRWDALTGEPLPGNLCPDRTIWSVASGTVHDGRSILVGAGHDHLVYRWDAMTGEPLGTPLSGHGFCVKSVEVITLPDGSTMIASGGEDAAVRRWEAISGAPFGAPLNGHEGQVLSLASVTLADGRILLASADSDGVIRRWDAITGEPIGRPIHTGAWAFQFAVIIAAEGPCLLAAGGDRLIRRIDLLTGALIGDPIPGVGVAAARALDGSTMIATSAYCGDITVQPLH
ncbi:hypothetical protein GCM10023195_76630 [Actinoallomurus liliacearum]|uniref:Uncharacterized protein n=1 Tax=Actinoallomurus liliacearum TaxID=1080073 RepID=A0ABP8TXI4_9ACTN